MKTEIPDTETEVGEQGAEGSSNGSPPPAIKKKGRRGRKKAQQPGELEEKAVASEKPVAKRGRPKKPKAVKAEPMSPLRSVLEPMASSTPLRGGTSTPPSQHDNNNTSNKEYSSKDEPKKSAKVVVKRRRGGGRRITKKNGPAGEGIRAVVTVSSKYCIDLDDFTPDEVILPEELVGFEHVEIFNESTMMAMYKLDNIQEPDINPYAMPMGSQFGGISFGARQSVAMQMAKTGTNSTFQIQA